MHKRKYMKRASFTLNCISLALSFYTHAMNNNRPSKAISLQSIRVSEKLGEMAKQELCSLDKHDTMRAEHIPKTLLQKKQRTHAPLIASLWLTELTSSSQATTSPQKCRPCDGGKNSTASQSMHCLDAIKKSVTQ